MTTVRSISEKQLETNRRNARQSTGPKTAAGKRASRVNVVTHGLLAKTIVITAGDYQEDPQAFAQLLEDLRARFTPVGVAEDLEVQKIVLYYWRKMRAVRYEHGAIRRRTVDLRERETPGPYEDFSADEGLALNRGRRSREIQRFMDNLEKVKQEVPNGTMPRGFHEWLVKSFPGEFAPPENPQGLEQRLADLHASRDNRRPVVSPDLGRQIVAKIENLLPRLAKVREQFVAIEALQLDSKILASALPAAAAVDKLIRYETSNDRALDRARRRLEGMQARRRKRGGTPAEP